MISEEENVNASERASYAPSWYTATMVPTAMRGPLTFDLDVDVCVIGGGLAGLTTAREIARRGWSVVVLETDRIAGNASGRNDGFVLPGFAESMERVVSRVGMEHAKALWDLSEMGLRYVRTTIAEARMPGYLDTPGGRVAILATTATFRPWNRAGTQRPDLRGRPGINPLGFKNTYTVDGLAFEIPPYC